MKKILTLLSLALFLSCSTDDGSSGNNTPTNRCYYNGHMQHTGPQGGCYYINSNGNKVYVDREHCNC